MEILVLNFGILINFPQCIILIMAKYHKYRNGQKYRIILKFKILRKSFLLLSFIRIEVAIFTNNAMLSFYSMITYRQYFALIGYKRKNSLLLLKNVDNKSNENSGIQQIFIQT